VAANSATNATKNGVDIIHVTHSHIAQKQKQNQIPIKQ
jgi:hypothetical protein